MAALLLYRHSEYILSEYCVNWMFKEAALLLCRYSEYSISEY